MKKNTMRLVSILLALSMMIMMFSGCGKTETPAAPAAPAEEPAKKGGFFGNLFRRK